MSENFEVPIIDIAPFLNGDLQDRVAVAKEIDTALSSVGCIYVNGHGIAQSQVDEAISWNRRFFALPDAGKHICGGYHAIGTEIIRSHVSVKECLAIRNPRSNSMPREWPAEECMPGFRSFIEDFWTNCAKLLDHLLDCVSLALELGEEHSLTKLHSRKCYTMNLLHYPPFREGLPVSDAGPRMAAHTDSSTLTLLFQDPTGGLEIGDRSSVKGNASAATFERRGGIFRAVQPRQGMVFVNVGFLLTRWSNARYKGTIHRVCSPTARMTQENTEQEERFSIPFFGDPDPGTVVDALPGTWNVVNPKRREPFGVDEYYKKKAKDTAA